MPQEPLFAERSLFTRTTCQALVLGAAARALPTAAQEPAPASTASPRQFRLWATSDAHVGTDLGKTGRESLADAIRQSEGFAESPGFDWDIALHLGDFSGNQGAPMDEEGEEVVRQFGALKKHSREHFYSIAGNHDATLPHEKAQWWFTKWIDPEGKHTAHSKVDPKNRPYPIEGTWERYSFRVGNLLFLMMSDRNDGGPPVGRGVKGGYPAGAVTSETFAWWKDAVAGNQDSIIISAHHHMLKETTVVSGEWEGFKWDEERKRWRSDYHGYYEDGGPKGASYLYWLDDQPDAQAFEGYLADHPGATDFWFGGHTHTNPEDRKNGRSHIEKKWGVHFANIAGLTQSHGVWHAAPMSRLFTFTEGSTEVRVQCYLHTSQFAPQGWYAPAERTLEMANPFQMA